MNTITIQDGSGRTTTPTLILGYQTSRLSRNIVHDTLDGGIAVSVYPARPRAGTLALLYPVEADAVGSLELHAAEAVFTLDSDERDVNMSYVVYGNVTMTLDEETRSVWVVEVDYQEIVP